MAASSSKSTHGECSSSAIVRRELPPRAHNEETLPTTPHDIFLSHSGVQKHFVKGLYKRLSPWYSTFFDIRDHSLPPGEIFSTHIFDNAKKCKLAVVVLSNDFVSSKWPMRELSTFVDAMHAVPPVRILPLFYDLSPTDVKCKDNVNRWREKWQTFAAHDPPSVSNWDNALRTVCSIGGLVFDKSEGEAAFLDKIVSKIFQIIPPTIKCNDTNIFGKDRLCEVILNKFKAMESCHGQEMEHYEQSRSTAQPKPCVLGMYGIPGSGKSTLSELLKEYLFSLYGGKVLYLKLPTTNPSPMDLINIFKKLLDLTDFRDMINLDNVSNLSMVFNLLKKHSLQKKRVFVVVDNIVNDRSLEAVKDFLDVGVGPGSKVLLVARTLDFLQEALVRGKEGQHFISDSMRVPHISEKEAMDILLHTHGAACVGGDDYAVKSTVTVKQTLVDVVRMCGFGSNPDDLLYLPLAMKIMGSLLMRYEGDVKKWTNALSRFRKKVKAYKEDAVKEIVRISFDELGDEQLQLLFLDVTLFIVPLKLGSLQEACDFLKILHACNQERMEIKIKELQRHCFLMIDQHAHDWITVHDVYTDFAKSIQEDPNFRLSSSPTRWFWMDCKCAGVEVGREMLLRQEEYATSDDQQVRTMIVEVGEGCERVEVHGFAGLKALVVRNCESLAVLKLAGLTSLVSMDIHNCPRMRQVDSHDCDFNKVKRLCVKESSATTLQVQPWKQPPQFHFPIVPGLQRMIAAVSGTFFSSPPRFFEGIATQMRGLQVLRLEQTGIKRLVDMSSCWPQLRELYVEEYDLEAFEIGSLQRLNRLQFRDSKLGSLREKDVEWCEPDKEKCVLYIKDDDSVQVVWRNPRRKLEGMDLMMKECPELEEVFIQSAYFDQRTLTPKVRSLEIQMHFALKIPDLTQSAASLEELKVHLCAKLERVDFSVKFERLSSLELLRCSRLVEVTGLGFLHNLRRLLVSDCPKLQTLDGFNNLRMLERIVVLECSELRKISDLSGLTSLEYVSLYHCGIVTVRWAIADFENSMDHEVQKKLMLPLDDHTSQVNLCGEPAASQSNDDGICNADQLRELSWINGELIAAGQSISHILNGSTLHELQSNPSTSILLGSVDPLSSPARSITLLPAHQLAVCTLQTLHLWRLPNLRGVPGLQSLIHLRSLTLNDCPQLEELPPLHGLVELRSLRIERCGKLKAVEGCDEMKSLERLEVTDCRSLECFVFRDLDTFLRGRRTDARDFEMEIWGCKFASIEAMVEWALDANVPEPLRAASRKGLEWEYYGKKRQEVVEAFFPKLVSKTLLNEDDCFDCDHLVACVTAPDNFVTPATKLKLRSMLERAPKQALSQPFESDNDFRFSIFDIIGRLHPNSFYLHPKYPDV